MDKKSEPLALHVPEPGCRPGDRPDFSGFDIPRAGAVRRPEADTSAEDMRDLAFSVVRVLNADGEAVGPWAGQLDANALRQGLRHMLTVRAFDERMLVAQRQGKMSFYLQCLGEEAVACAFRRALQEGDMNFPTYRQVGLLIADDYPLESLMNQCYSNAHDPIKGRQLPTLYSSKEHGFFSISGNLGTQFVQAVGWAMASAIQHDSKIAAAWIGDGSTSESDFHAAMVFASTYRAPVVLNVVNNQWAISTFQGMARGNSATFAARGHGFGIPSIRVDGNDYLAVHAVAKWAAERARSGHGPTLIEHLTYRAGGHSSSDDPTSYRAKGESSAWPLGDPIDRLKTHLIAQGEWSESRHAQLGAEIDDEVRQAQKNAEAVGTLTSGESSSSRDIFEGVFETMPAHLIAQRQEAGY